MEGFEKIMMNDGDRDIAMTIVATFTMDDQDYAVLDGDEDNERYVLRMIEQEFNDAVQIFEELVEEQQ